jgi:hypothetical protein
VVATLPSSDAVWGVPVNDADGEMTSKVIVSEG